MIVASILTPLEHLLRHVLDWLHTSAGLPWAWSIVALTVIVRMILVPLTVRQIHSMQRMQAHLPEMKAIQQKYKTDKPKQQEELMKFYRENNINPASSCLPMLAQFPVFIALYYVLRNFSKTPPPGDLSWLHVVPNIADKVNAHWSGYLLVLIYAISQVASTYFMSATMDKAQRTLMMVFPLFFVAFIVHPIGTSFFPTGLLLYWVTTNLWTVGQGLVTRRLVPRTPAPTGPKRASRKPGSDDGGGNGATRKPPAPKPAPAAAVSARAAPRQVRRKKKKTRR
jgi:YidC/Oxa1 family membrane protein insertase